MSLNQKIAWITGAASGVGRATCERFAKEGARVIASDINEALLKKVARGFGPNAFILPFDLSDVEGHAARVDSVVVECGGLDVLVNCGAQSPREPVVKVTPTAMRRILAVNLEGPFFLAQACAQEMAKRRQGKIINITSVNDSRPLTWGSVYSISKAGMNMMTRCMALELAPFGIQVNAIAPGALDTPMNATLQSDPEARRRVERLVPMARLGKAEEIAAAALFLASDDASYMTGATLYLDGGLSIPIGYPPALDPGSAAQSQDQSGKPRPRQSPD